MGEIDLTPQQIAFASIIGQKLKVSGYVLLPYDDFGQHFGRNNAAQLTFVLSTNAWKMKLDETLQLVVVTYDAGKTATWPIEDLKRQVVSMERRGVQEEDRK